LYKKWASSYDSAFAEVRAYSYPQHIAEVYKAFSNVKDAPILDVGAGTGLVAAELLKLGEYIVDAVDISPEMLDVSRKKKLYRSLIEADLSNPLAIEDETYGALLSAGTFTHGHVGPQAFKELLRIAKPNAIFCLGINAKAFDGYGFGSALAGLQADNYISPLEFVKANYYKQADDEHADDVGFTAIFRKT